MGKKVKLEPQVLKVQQVLKVSQANHHSSDFPSYRQAMSGPERAKWQEACEAEMANLERYQVYTPVPEDSVPTWDAVRKRASEVVDMMIVLKKKYNELRELLKYKARCTVRGAHARVWRGIAHGFHA